MVAILHSNVHSRCLFDSCTNPEESTRLQADSPAASYPCKDHEFLNFAATRMTATCSVSACCAKPFSNTRLKHSPMASLTPLQPSSQARSTWSASWGQRQTWPIELHRRPVSNKSAGIYRREAYILYQSFELLSARCSLGSHSILPSAST